MTPNIESILKKAEFNQEHQVKIVKTFKFTDPCNKMYPGINPVMVLDNNLTLLQKCVEARLNKCKDDLMVAFGLGKIVEVNKYAIRYDTGVLIETYDIVSAEIMEDFLQWKTVPNTEVFTSSLLGQIIKSLMGFEVKDHSEFPLVRSILIEMFMTSVNKDYLNVGTSKI